MRKEFKPLKDFVIKPIGFHEACKFVKENHSYLPSPRGCKFAISVWQNDQIKGVVIVGRPISPQNDDNITAEVSRLAVKENFPNAASCLLGAAWRCAKAMGYQRMISYVTAELNGESFIAAGWKFVITRKRVGWHNRETKLPINDSQAVTKFMKSELPPS